MYNYVIMTKLIIVRHGYSKANEQNIFLGHGNMDLTEKGHTQAQLTAEYLQSVQIDAIYSSDLDRAMQTAEHTAKLKNLPIIKSKGLREIDAGVWDFMVFDKLRIDYPEEFDKWYNDVANCRCPGGESYREMQDRMFSTVTSIAEENAGKTVALFSHATAVKGFICKVLGITDQETARYPYPSNASITILEYENGKFTLIEYSKDDFLSTLKTALPEDI